ncbi:MAG: hypothetical protein LC135_10705 [Phycisphaerae bacterium]|nr:hypothetical protein [Phycisphaerae bacterium]MCZ2400319.1 hypothetical protein [Phycisphaerae bacterium]
MDLARYVLLESPLVLGIVLVLINFALLVAWRRGGSPRPLLSSLGASAILLVVQALVVTQRERAGLVLAAIERDLVVGRLGALDAALAADFETQGVGRAEFLAMAAEALRHVRVTWLRRTELALAPADGEGFAVEAAYIADLDARDYRGTLRSRWRIAFARREGRWRITTIEPLRIDGVTDNDWKRLMR